MHSGAYWTISGDNFQGQGVAMGFCLTPQHETY
jgi:hypothetical protein